MPSSFSAVADELDAIIARTKQAQYGALAKAMRDLQARINVGLGSRSEWDVRNLQQLENMIEGALRDSGFNAVAAHFGQAALDMAHSVDAGIKAVTFGQGEANMLTSAVTARMEGWSKTVADAPMQYIRDLLTQNTITGMDSADMATMLSDRFVALDEYAQTYIETALYQQSRDTWAVAGESMGAEIYRYSGPPLISTSHEFCVEHYEEERPLSEWEGMDNDTDLPVVWSCGGWGCRHFLEPVPP